MLYTFKLSSQYEDQRSFWSFAFVEFIFSNLLITQIDQLTIVPYVKRRESHHMTLLRMLDCDKCFNQFVLVLNKSENTLSVKEYFYKIYTKYNCTFVNSLWLSRGQYGKPKKKLWVTRGCLVQSCLKVTGSRFSACSLIKMLFFCFCCIHAASSMRAI